MRFEIVMNIGAWRDLHRHRIQTQQRERFTIVNGFDIPEGLKEAGLDQKYIDATRQAEELFKKIGEDICCNLGSVNIAKMMESGNDFFAAIYQSIYALDHVSRNSELSSAPSIEQGNQKNH